MDDITIDVPPKRIVGIDIGLTHLAMIKMIGETVVDMHVVDIYKIPCVRSPCLLHHTKSLSDCFDHLLYKYEAFLADFDHIVIERQPPKGFVSVEQLFFRQFRDRATLVHPTSMRKYFPNVWSDDYDERKRLAVKWARQRLLQQQDGGLRNKLMLQKFDAYNRNHDIADAILLAYYFLFNQ